MPQAIDRTGTFRFMVLDHAVSTTKNKFPQVSMKLKAVEYYDEETSEWQPWAEYEVETTAYLILFYKDDKDQMVAARNVEQLQKAVGWNGQSLAGLNDMDLSNKIIQGRVAENKYNGKTTLRVEWIDAHDAIPGGMKRLDAAALSDLDKQFGGLLGGKKPAAKAPAAPPKAPPKATPPTPSADPGDAASEAAADVEPSPTSDVPSDPTPAPGAGKGPVTAAPDVAGDAGTTPPTAPPKAGKKKGGKKGSKKAAPAADSSPQAEGLSMEITDKESAWKSCNLLKREDVTDDALGSAFVDAMEAQGDDEDEFQADDWKAIRNATLDQIPHYKF